MVIISFLDAPDSQAEALLEGQTYFVGLHWNELAKWWTMSIKSFDGQVLLSGIRLRPGWPATRRFRRPGLPPGEFTVHTPSDQPLNRESFATGKALMVYFDAAELAADGFEGYGVR